MCVFDVICNRTYAIRSFYFLCGMPCQHTPSIDLHYFAAMWRNISCTEALHMPSLAYVSFLACLSHASSSFHCACAKAWVGRNRSRAHLLTTTRRTASFPIDCLCRGVRLQFFSTLADLLQSIYWLQLSTSSTWLLFLLCVSVLFCLLL